MRSLLPFLVSVLVGTLAFVQPAPLIVGVWKISQRITPAGNPRTGGVAVTQDNPRPNILIFTRQYYSEIIEMGAQPRPAAAAGSSTANPRELTDAEKIALYDQWRPFTANSGTYEIAGSVLVRHPIVAKNLEVMTRGSGIPVELKFEDANTVWLIPTREVATAEPRVKLTRLE
jgi:hypothetical protein